MEIFWFIIVTLVLSIFFVLDGYDFGTGIIHLFMAKTEKDKVVISKSAGLFWDSNEVWLVAGGGLLFMAFPTLYASAFSGFYLPLIFILWLIIFRAIGLELRNQFSYQMWKDFWDKAFGMSSLLLALFFGIALGNVIRGVNLGGVENGTSAYAGHFFFLPLWNSHFSPEGTHPGVIDWFTIIIGLQAVVTLAMHGAHWIILKTNSSINDQLKKVSFRLNVTLVILSIITLVLWQIIKPNPFDNFLDKPLLMIAPIIYLSVLIGLFFMKKDIARFAFSSLIIVSGIMSSLMSMFPVVLPSTNDVNESLTIYNTAASEYGLSVAMNWGIVGVTLLFVYAIVQKKIMGGKIDEMDYGH